ncbi:hypothetical protein RFI_23159 [Reticulomyxa filosa]|uniref:Uncharacterized protein n=1 Tax=Reticulomyxa filosa TaxID=46433 RepID=X6MM97_RETFI|nr:hypothetical protein RFI_23159 [Reticulomyxa filosa]|eukprot:ETO14210.1 hypothetical protein RFI_23159 [Reticulomyxa filosa]
MNEFGTVHDRNPYGIGECKWLFPKSELEYIYHKLPKASHLYGPPIIILWNNYPIVFRLKWFAKGCGKRDGEDGVLEKNRLNVDLHDCPEYIHTINCRITFECANVFWNQSFDIKYINDPKQLMKSWGFPDIPINLQELLNGPMKMDTLQIYAYIRVKKCYDANKQLIPNLAYGTPTIPAVMSLSGDANKSSTVNQLIDIIRTHQKHSYVK